jgi:hypothetical protein
LAERTLLVIFSLSKKLIPCSTQELLFSFSTKGAIETSLLPTIISFSNLFILASNSMICSNVLKESLSLIRINSST